MAWRHYFMLAVLMMVFAFAHIFALQKLNAMQSERPATIDFLADYSASPEAALPRPGRRGPKVWFN